MACVCGRAQCPRRTTDASISPSRPSTHRSRVPTSFLALAYTECKVGRVWQAGGDVAHQPAIFPTALYRRGRRGICHAAKRRCPARLPGFREGRPAPQRAAPACISTRRSPSPSCCPERCGSSTAGVPQRGRRARIRAVAVRAGTFSSATTTTASNSRSIHGRRRRQLAARVGVAADPGNRQVSFSPNSPRTSCSSCTTAFGAPAASTSRTIAAAPAPGCRPPGAAASARPRLPVTGTGRRCSRMPLPG